MFFFSLPREKKQPKRELVARFESEQITILKNCAAGLATLKQVLALTSSPFFQSSYLLPASLTSSNSLTLGIAHACMALLSLNRDFRYCNFHPPLPSSPPRLGARCSIKRVRCETSKDGRGGIALNPKPYILCDLCLLCVLCVLFNYQL